MDSTPPTLKKNRKWILQILIAAGAGWFIKSFLISFYMVPSGSMENTLLPGDGILVSKIHYGTYISFFDFNKTKIHIPGLTSIKIGDVVVFNSPLDKGLTFVKRCIGTPGEIVEIKNSIVFINQVPINENYILHNYKLISKKKPLVDRLIDSLKLVRDQHSYKKEENLYVVSLSKLMVNKLASINYIDTIFKMDQSIKKNTNIFPVGMSNIWNENNYGPLLVPKKGMKIKLTNLALSLYADLISSEGNNLSVSENGVLINGRIVKTYTFRNSYYFMMGDNRDNSSDSRWIGFIPRQLIIGKANFVLYSMDYSTRWFRKGRILRAIF